MTGEPPIAQAIDSLLRRIPECWEVVDIGRLTSAEDKALFLLTAAGLVERCLGFRLAMAGQETSMRAKFSVTGEGGLEMALGSLVEEMWTRWEQAYIAWTAGKAAASSPFRGLPVGEQQWRLTDQGVMARRDLDVEAPSAGSAAFVRCRQYVLEYVMRTGHQRYRLPAGGEGRLLEFALENAAEAEQAARDSAQPAPTPVAIANAEELARVFERMFAARILAEKGTPAPAAKPPVGEGMTVEEAMRRAEEHVKAHKGVFPGRNKLAEIIGCSRGTLNKAIANSVYLKARQAEHEAAKKGGNRERQISGSMDEIAVDESRPEAGDSPDDRMETLTRLAEEQAAEFRRDMNRPKKAKRKPGSD